LSKGIATAYLRKIPVGRLQAFSVAIRKGGTLRPPGVQSHAA
jgi:hypothetical protein